ncbi:hypothetical protein L911_0144 [Vibrio fluvialis I21563]|nr:hypothetical protein L911_0144 [Vibrio fluvialis I21563]
MVIIYAFKAHKENFLQHRWQRPKSVVGKVLYSELWHLQ